MARPTLQLNAVEALLTEHGGEMRAVEIASALGMELANLNPTLLRGAARGRLARRREGRAAFYSLGDGTPAASELALAADADDFNAALWADGDLVLVGVELNADGRSVTLNPKRAQMVRRLLNGGE